MHATSNQNDAAMNSISPELLNEFEPQLTEILSVLGRRTQQPARRRCFGADIFEFPAPTQTLPLPAVIS